MTMMTKMTMLTTTVRIFVNVLVLRCQIVRWFDRHAMGGNKPIVVIYLSLCPTLHSVQHIQFAVEHFVVKYSTTIRKCLKLY